MSALRATQGVGVLLLAVAHHDELHVTGDTVAFVLHEPVQDRDHDVYALLPRQPSDEANKHGPFVHLEPDSLLESSLVEALASLEILNGVPLLDVLVDLRVPTVVDAVQDAAQAQGVPLRLHEGLQPEAAGRGLDFLRVVRRHRDHAVGADQRSLAEVHGVAQADVRGGKFGDAEEVASLNVRVLALVAQVVHDVDDTRLHVAIVWPVLVAQVERHQTSLPIVGQKQALLSVNLLAVQLQDQRRLQRRQREQGEAEEVVRILPAVVAVVQASILFDAGMLHEDIVATAFVLVPILDHLLAISNHNLGLGDVSQTVVVLVLRGDGHGPVALARKLVGVGGGDEAQASGLGVRGDLRGDDDHGHVQVLGLVGGHPLGRGPGLLLLHDVRHLG
mmetsp:Transcript_90929/g.291578  ORF Transcript_90929/g.291578 Transcript_90929/m.291578 type:complete len:390 (+) Transcript_90929:552-1721(+)